MIKIIKFKTIRFETYQIWNWIYGMAKTFIFVWTCSKPHDDYRTRLSIRFYYKNQNTTTLMILNDLHYLSINSCKHSIEKVHWVELCLKFQSLCDVRPQGSCISKQWWNRLNNIFSSNWNGICMQRKIFIHLINTQISWHLVY